jgi:hypothetical protein
VAFGSGGDGSDRIGVTLQERRFVCCQQRRQRSRRPWSDR